MSNIRETISEMLRDRAIVITLIIIGLLLVAIVIIAAIYIRPSDLQVPVRYSAFGITNFYRDKWYYELVLALFGFVMAGLHLAIGVKLYQIKGRELAYPFLWLTIGLLAITTTLLLAILQVASLSQ
jgi:hypothetical protein